MDILNNCQKKLINHHNQHHNHLPSNNEQSPITNFYNDKSILITGATGFIGKVLIEKLLYSCPQVKKLYLLIRSSKGKSPYERMIDMIEQKPFTVRLKRDFILSKLVPIESDLALKELGLSNESQQLLIDEIGIIFHVAASVKFEAPLEVNMRHNVVATKELLQFACNFKRLTCFVHVSTAYSNCQMLQIDECVYKMPLPDDPMSLEITKQLLDNRPNTYTFTKAMAENVAQQYANRINVVIVRPSIVMSSMKEPAEGWVDTINGPVGLSILGALGILQKIKVNSEVVFDLIPVDIVTNALLSIAWATTECRKEFNSSLAIERVENAKELLSTIEEIDQVEGVVDKKVLEENNNDNNNITKENNSNKLINNKNKKEASDSSSNVVNGGGNVTIRSRFGRIFNNDYNESNNLTNNSNSNSTTKKSTNDVGGKVCVFNLTTGSENPCSFYHYFNTGRQEAYDKPSIRALRPLLHIPKQKGMNPIQYWIHKVFSHLLFAYVMDFLLILFGQKTMVVKSVNRMHHANEMFDYFCSNQWNFKTDNVKKLRQLQSSSDKETFNCDVRQIDWNSYARIGWLGCRRFILRETDDSIGYAKKRYLVICVLYPTVKILLILANLYLASLFIESQLILCSMMILISGLVYLL